MRIVCEGATGFKMIPSKPTSRKKPQQPTLDLIGTLVLQQTTFKRLQKGTLINALGSHKYHSELGNPLCKRKENSCAL